MSSIALKIGSLAIKTFSKPIANWIKRQAREHEGFKRRCVQGAQALHRVDMSLRLGLLRQSAILEKEAEREAHKSHVPTVKTEAEALLEEAKSHEKPKPVPKPKIKPLSEARAIDTGANFISEAFLFTVASGLIIFESARAKKKDDKRKDAMEEKIVQLEESEAAARQGLFELEKEILRLRAKETKLLGPKHQERILSKSLWENQNEVEETPELDPWYARVTKAISDTFTTAEATSTAESSTSTTKASIEPSKEAPAAAQPAVAAAAAQVPASTPTAKKP